MVRVRYGLAARPGAPSHQFTSREFNRRMKAFASLRLLFALAALCLLGGCSHYYFCGERYEYRYRVFEAKETMPKAMEGPIGSDILAQRYNPPSEINKCLDSLTAEGFKLWRIEKVRDTNYYTFILRRPVIGKMAPMRAPTEFCGVYQVQAPNDQTTFYAFQPTYYGYTVIRFHGADDPAIIETKWDGDKLVADAAGVHHIFILTADGFSIVHSEDHLLAKGLDRKIFNARRINTAQP